MQSLGGPSSAVFRSKIANGASVRSPITTGSVGSPPAGIGPTTVDPVNAVVTSTSREQFVANSDPEGPRWEDCGLLTNSDNYDAASRLTSKSFSMALNTSIADCTNATFDGGSSPTYTYDAENHTLSMSDAFGSAKWSPSGHAYQIDSANIHYDGDGILFITDAAGALTQAKVETLGDIVAGGQLTILDRGVSHQYVSKHNGLFYGGIALGTTIYKNKDQGAATIPYIFAGSTNDPTCYHPSPGAPCAVGAAGNLEYDRLEGFEYNGLTFQGVRAVDESSGKWTTPDAYAGSVHDPLSQKRFMWDRNNPYDYNDPSGFAPNGSQPSGDGKAASQPSAREAHDQLQNFNFGEPDGRFFLPTVLSILGLLIGGEGKAVGALEKGAVILTEAGDHGIAVGRRGLRPELVFKGNVETKIGPLVYSGHALDQMQGRGFLTMMVEDIIAHPTELTAQEGGKMMYGNPLGRVVLNNQFKVITVIAGR